MKSLDYVWGIHDGSQVGELGCCFYTGQMSRSLGIRDYQTSCDKNAIESIGSNSVLMVFTGPKIGRLKEPLYKKAGEVGSRILVNEQPILYGLYSVLWGLHVNVIQVNDSSTSMKEEMEKCAMAIRNGGFYFSKDALESMKSMDELSACLSESLEEEEFYALCVDVFVPDPKARSDMFDRIGYSANEVSKIREKVNRILCRPYNKKLTNDELRSYLLSVYKEKLEADKYDLGERFKSLSRYIDAPFGTEIFRGYSQSTATGRILLP